MIIGLVGKPSAGKSTFFKAATMIDVKITGIPFTTITPNTGIGHVVVDCVDKEFNVKCSPKHGHCKNGKRFVPVKLVDVGGLIPGSHLGRGIGNKFLNDLRQASVMIQVVDASGLTDSEGKPTSGYDPSTEIEFLEREIDLWFAEVIKKAVEKFERRVVSSTRADLVQILSEQLSGLEITKRHIEYALEKASVSDVEKFATVIRRISKPILIAANKIDLKPAQENFEKMKTKHQHIMPTSAEAEYALEKAAEKNFVEYVPGDGFEIKDNMDEKQKAAIEFIKKEVVDKYGSTGVQSALNKSVFELLNYIAVYPVADAHKLTDTDGNVLPDVFLVPSGITLKEFAAKIHTDFVERFIGGLDARTRRKIGADYVLKDRDVVQILFRR